MDELLHNMAGAIRLGITMGVAGAIFCFGVAVIGRWLKWAPININVTVNKLNEQQ